MFNKKNAYIVSFFSVLTVLGAQAVYAAEPAAKNITELPKSKLQREVLKRDWGRDPFSQPEKKEAVTKLKPQIQLMGILTRGEKKIAIINKTFVRPGETFQGYTVVSIEMDRVVLNKDGKETVLRITDNDKKI